MKINCLKLQKLSLPPIPVVLLTCQNCKDLKLLKQFRQHTKIPRKYLMFMLPELTSIGWGGLNSHEVLFCCKLEVRMLIKQSCLTAHALNDADFGPLDKQVFWSACET